MAASARKKFKLFLLLLITVFWILNCASHKLGINGIPKGQKFLFEVSYVNFAWGYDHHGIYIDRSGNIYGFAYDRDDRSWRYSKTTQSKETDIIEVSVLMERYSHNKRLFKRIRVDTLREKYALIQSASSGELTGLKHTAYDAGATTYRAFIYDEKNKGYLPVLLRQEGDYSRENLSPSTVSLVDWLYQLWLEWCRQRGG